MAGEAAATDVSVVVAVKDRRELMLGCLDGILGQELPGGAFEVVVVDNASTDGTPEAVRARAATAPVAVRVVHEPGSLGRVRNVGVAAGRAPIVAFTDSDCVPAPGWLAALVAPFADPAVAVVQGRTAPDPATPMGRFAATQDLPGFTHRYETCNIAYRVDALQAAGGFDEDVGFFGEDTAAGWAVRRAGWAAAFAGDAVVHHAVTHPGLAWHLRRSLGYGNWNALVRRFPEMRDEILWHRWFLRRRNAEFVAAVAGVGLAALTRRAPFAALALPYARRRRGPLADSAAGVAFDAAVLAGLVRGSIRERTLVL